MTLPENLELSVFHDVLLYFVKWAGNPDFLTRLSEVKADNSLIEIIADSTEKELQVFMGLETLTFNRDSWSNFLEDLRQIPSLNDQESALVLGTVMEIMDELEWKNHFAIREFLSLFLESDTELAHFKLAIAGTKWNYLAQVTENLLERSKLRAKTKSKIQ